jgi:hypothetical protein
MVDETLTLTQTETEQWVAMMSPIAEEIHALKLKRLELSNNREVREPLTRIREMLKTDQSIKSLNDELDSMMAAADAGTNPLIWKLARVK